MKIQTIYGTKIPVNVLIVPKIEAPLETKIETEKQSAELKISTRRY